MRCFGGPGGSGGCQPETAERMNMSGAVVWRVGTAPSSGPRKTIGITRERHDAARRAVNTADPGARLARGLRDADSRGSGGSGGGVRGGSGGGSSVEGGLELLVRCPAKAGHYGRLSPRSSIATVVYRQSPLS